VRSGRLGAEPLGVVPSSDEQQRRGVRADPVEGKKAGGMRPHAGDDELIETFELGARGTARAEPGPRSAMRVA